MQKITNRIDKNSKIAVLCGGLSSEAEVSMRSGKGCYEALKRLGFDNSELVVVDKDIALKLKEGHYDYAFNALHGKYGEDGCIQGILEILRIPYAGCGVMASSVCMNKEFTKRILSTNPDIIMARSAFVKKGEDVLVIIGPEGGFSDREFRLFEDKKCDMLTLGNLILKAETAVTVALGNIIYEFSGKN